MSTGWYNESRRHSLASRGIKSSGKIQAKDLLHPTLRNKHFDDMIKDEQQAHEHYLEMAEIYREDREYAFAKLFDTMAWDEHDHKVFLELMQEHGNVLDRITDLEGELDELERTPVSPNRALFVEEKMERIENEVARLNRRFTELTEIIGESGYEE